MNLKNSLKTTTMFFLLGTFSACGPQGFDASTFEGGLDLNPDVSSAHLLGGQQNSQDVASTGIVKPTIYYFPSINEDDSSCTANRSLTGKNGSPLARVCAKTIQACTLQGSCAVIQEDRLRTFNVIEEVRGQHLFFETTDDECKFGYGVESSCLDPFYTVAADLNIYDPGDVIYIPALRGLELPNGSKHNGFFIVRDKGNGIVGEGRFDFFSGYFSWKHEENPFTKMGLGDKNNRLRYYKIKGATAKAVRNHRDFPNLPENSIDIQP